MASELSWRGLISLISKNLLYKYSSMSDMWLISAPLSSVTMSLRVFVNREIVCAPLSTSLNMSALKGRHEERKELMSIIEPNEGAVDDFRYEITVGLPNDPANAVHRLENQLL